MPIIIQTIISAILSWFAKFIGTKVKESTAAKERQENIKKETHEKIDAVKNAQTEAEVEKAADDLAKHSF